MNFSGIIGLISASGMLFLALFMGEEPGMFIYMPSVLIVLGFPLSTALMSLGIADCIVAGSALRVVVFRVPCEELSPQQARNLRTLIPTIYAAGAIAMLIDVQNMLTWLEDPERLGAAVILALTRSMTYSLLLAEGLFRPAARHIEHRLGPPKPDIGIQDGPE